MVLGKEIKKRKFTPYSIQRLNDYILSEDGKGNPDHKVMFSGVTGCVGNASTITRDMEDLAAQNTRCRNPIMHCLISWREGEQPSEEQVKRAVKISLEELGLEGHQCVWALHKDTDNYHAHISINRINPITFRAVNPANGWTQKAMERAARRVEYEQGWELEENAWTTHDGDEVRPDHERVKRETAATKIPMEVQDMEVRTGEKSAVRIASERLTGKKFSSWDELHKELAEMGMKYEKKGSGAVIFVGDTAVKASSAGKKWSLSYLEKSLGEFQPAALDVVKNVREEHISEPLKAQNDTPEWREYLEDRERYREQKKAVKGNLLAEIAEEKRELSERHKMEWAIAFKGKSFKGRGKTMNSLKSALSARHDADRAELRKRLAEQRKRFAEAYGSFPSYEEWLRERGKEAEAEAWRDRASAKRKTPLFIVPGGGARTFVEPERGDIRGFLCKEQAHGLLFVNKSTGVNSFTDTGKAIRVYSNDDAALVASLQIAAKKWDTVQLNGSADFKRKALLLAVENGITITNPELQGEYKELLEKKRAAERERREAERAEQGERKEALDFRRYHEAVGAERYKVTATQIFDDGTKRGFMVNKRDGAPDGFTPDELAEKMPRLISLKGRDRRNIYYTPISEDKHHILIDDMDHERLADLIFDGFEPAAIIETSPNNFQAVITIPKLGTEMDREIGNEIVARLNKKYGDPKVSGEIHAHRAPGFDNKKPKHRGMGRDGGFPDVQLIKAKRVECAKTSELAKQIQIELVARAQKMERAMSGAAASLSPDEQSAVPSAKAYEVHFKDVYRLQKRDADALGRQVDLSKVDSMVCLRMRVTGHSQEEIRSTVEVMAPRMREAIGDTGTHVWRDYAERTARHVFSIKGDRAVEETKHYWDYWKQVERRAEPVKARPISERAARRMGLRRERGVDIDR